MKAKFFFGSLLLISQILLPWLNQGQNFFLFSTWNFFLASSVQRARDISCGSQSFLFRDHRTELKGLNLSLFYLQVQHEEKEKIKLSLPLIQNVCTNQPLELVTFQATTFEYFILKESYPIMNRETL
jgi:hypothetical protein